MALTLLSLPLDIQLIILSFFWQSEEHAACLSLSTTCTFYRSLLAPRIFRTIHLRNTEKSSESIKALAGGSKAEHVEELRVEALLYREDHDSPDDAGSFCQKSLCKAARTVLCDLKAFENLNCLRIEFPFGPSSEYPDPYFDLIYTEGGGKEANAKEEEAANKWRALMADTYAAVIQNPGPRLKRLELAELIYKPVSTFTDGKFHEFLGQLESFTVSIRGAENGAGWNINTTEEYPGVMLLLTEHFFPHMSALTDLAIIAPETGPIGLEGMNHVPFGLSPQWMPCLKSLNLEQAFVEPGLIEFIGGHSQTLESLSLVNCFSDSPSSGFGSLAENGISWSDFFDGVRGKNMSQLRRLHLSPSSQELVGPEPTPEERLGSYLSEDDATPKLRHALKEQPDRQVFLYAVLDDKYGTRFDCTEADLESFEVGKDQRAYDLLMEEIGHVRSSLPGLHS